MKLLYYDEKVIVVERNHNYVEYVVLQENGTSFVPGNKKDLIDFLNTKGFKKAAASIKKH